ncbi:hypothetical protein BSK56_13080 [Paenibacillus borealis]|uniref:Uncharacterized protein n=1 Tax=Paenibacillus borealis TaxID=160799 RepID=A0ABX3HAI3_PAEBO|nr:hypothetical protein BSK56_13080 [Paenibacillus borealis]
MLIGVYLTSIRTQMHLLSVKINKLSAIVNNSCTEVRSQPQTGNFSEIRTLVSGTRYGLTIRKSDWL